MGLSNSIFCAAGSCFDDDSDAQVSPNAVMEMTIDTLKSVWGFSDCPAIADQQATIDLMDALENKFQPGPELFALRPMLDRVPFTKCCRQRREETPKTRQRVRSFQEVMGMAVQNRSRIGNPVPSHMVVLTLVLVRMLKR